MAPQARPFAQSPFPDAVRVDLESAAVEEFKARHPDQLRPVIGTMALAHGSRAAGATSLRTGFAWNPQTDLLWAVGFPHVVLIADGLPEGQSRQAMIDHWGAQGRGGWIRCSARTNPLIIPRRGAHAVLYEIEHPEDDAFDLADDAFLEMSDPPTIDAVKTADLLRKVQSQGDLPRATLVIEALVGPSVVLSALCAIAEDPAFDERSAEFRGRAVHAMMPLLRRVPVSEASEFRRRLKAVSGGPEGFDAFVALAVDPLGYARAELERGAPGYALDALQWVDEQDDLVVRAYDTRDSFPDVPNPREMFVGGRAIIEREAANAGKYDSRDVQDGYLHHYTTIRSLELLPAVLEYSKGPALRAWLIAHASELRPGLLALLDDATAGSAASRALELIDAAGN